MEATLASELTSAELCRRNQWPPGTYLRCESRTGGGTTYTEAIRLTAIGDAAVLAVPVSPYNGRPRAPEYAWNLTHKTWAPFTPPNTDDQQKPITDDARCNPTNNQPPLSA